MKLKNLTLSLALVAGTLFAMPSFAHNGHDHHMHADKHSHKMMMKGNMMNKDMMMKKDMMMDKSNMMMNKDMMMDKSNMMMDKGYMMSKDMMDKDMMMKMYMPDMSVFGGYDYHSFDKDDMMTSTNGVVLGGRLLYPVYYKNMVMLSAGGEASVNYGMGSKDMMMNNMSYTMKHSDMGVKGRVLGQAAFMMDSGDAVLLRAGLGYGYTKTTYKANDMMKEDMKVSSYGPEASLYVGYQFMKHYEIGVEGYVGSETMKYDNMDMMKSDMKMPMMDMMKMKDKSSTLKGVTLTVAYHF